MLQFLSAVFIILGVFLQITEPVFAQDCLSGFLSKLLSPVEVEIMDAHTIRMVGILEGKFGGKRYKYKKKFLESWGSLGPDRRAPQGNPMWIFENLGPKTLEFFGFEKGSDFIILPDAEEIMGAIKRYNALPKTKDSPVITLGVYSEKLLHAPQENYLRKFVTDGTLPIGESGNYFIHDLSYHFLSALLLPPKLSLHVRKQTAALFEFQSYLRQTDPEFASSFFVKLIFKEIFEERARQIDFGTAGVTQQFRKDAHKVSLDRIVDTMTLKGASPQNFLRSMIHSDDLNSLAAISKEESTLARFRKYAFEFDQKRRQSSLKYLEFNEALGSEEDILQEILTRVKQLEREIQRSK